MRCDYRDIIVNAELKQLREWWKTYVVLIKLALFFVRRWGFERSWLYEIWKKISYFFQTSQWTYAKRICQQYTESIEINMTAYWITVYNCSNRLIIAQIYWAMADNILWNGETSGYISDAKHGPYAQSRG